MARIVLIHWNAAEAAERAVSLRAAGHEVDYHWQAGKAWLPDRQRMPEALVVSLDRLPSHGRAVAEWFHGADWRRSTPLIFCGGAADKVELIRARFPAALFCTWEELPNRLKQSAE